MTYDEFVARIRTMQADTAGNDADLAAIMPACLDYAELRCLRDLLPDAALRRQETDAAAGTSRLQLPGDFVAARQVRQRTAGVVRILRKRDSRYLDEYWPDETVTGTPKYWATVGYGEVRVAPASPTDAKFDLQYVFRPAPLSSSNQQTWLSVWAPDLLLAAAMIFLAGYTRNYGAGDDPRQVAHWEGEYQKTLAGLLREEAMRRSLVDTPPGA